MKESKKTGSGCSCCTNSHSVLLGRGKAKYPSKGMTRADFLKVIGLGTLGLGTIIGTDAFARAAKNPDLKMVKGTADVMIIDGNKKQLRISATVTRDASKPAVVDWGRRFQAFFGTKGGKMEKYFVFTTDVSRTEVDRALRGLGIRSRRQIPFSEVKMRTGLKATTTRDDYLNGDPIVATVRWKKAGNIVESALEDLIDEKIIVEGAEVIKPYTPHFVYHGSGESFNFPSGCIVCPSDCNGGIITDNVLPLKTTVNYYKVNWDRMPAVGSKVEVVLKSIYS